MCLDAFRREGCGIRVTTAGLQGSTSGIVHVSSRLCAVYAHVIPPFGNPLGYRGERPLLNAPFSTEMADVWGTFNLRFLVSTLTQSLPYLIVVPAWGPVR